MKPPTSYLFDGMLDQKKHYREVKDAFFSISRTCSFVPLRWCFLPKLSWYVYKYHICSPAFGAAYGLSNDLRQIEKFWEMLLCYLVCFSRMRSATPMKKIGQPVTPVATADSTWPSSEQWAVQPDDLLYIEGMKSYPFYTRFIIDNYRNPVTNQPVYID